MIVFCVISAHLCSLRSDGSYTLALVGSHSRGSRLPGHTFTMVGKAQEVPGSARNGLVLREGVRKNHYTEFEFYRATTRRFSVSRPFRPEPSGSRGRGTLSRWHGNTPQPLVAPETASFRVSAHEKSVTQMSENRLFPPGHSARHQSRQFF